MRFFWNRGYIQNDSGDIYFISFLYDFSNKLFQISNAPFLKIS